MNITRNARLILIVLANRPDLWGKPSEIADWSGIPGRTEKSRHSLAGQLCRELVNLKLMEHRSGGYYRLTDEGRAKGRELTRDMGDGKPSSLWDALELLARLGG